MVLVGLDKLESMIMLISLKVTTKQNTVLHIFWSINATPLPYAVTYKAKELARSVGQQYRSHTAHVVR